MLRHRRALPRRQNLILIRVPDTARAWLISGDPAQPPTDGRIEYQRLGKSWCACSIMPGYLSPVQFEEGPISLGWCLPNRQQLNDHFAELVCVAGALFSSAFGHASNMAAAASCG
jgi:hypothetical protein